MTAVEDLKRALAEATGTDEADWFPVLKARYAMLEVFTALAERRGRSAVVTQALTCATAVDPIVVAGLRPVYADIDPGTYAIRPGAVAWKDGPAAAVIQHTFGVIDDASSVDMAAAARSAGALVVEDSAHCAGRMARGVDGAPLADVSFHSFGIEKQLPTKFGGAVWLSPDMPHREMRSALADRLSSLRQPGARLAFAVKTYRLQRGVLNRLPRALARPLERALTSAGLFEPAVARAEVEGRLTRGALGIPEHVAAEVAEALGRLTSIEEGRTAAVDAYLDALGGAIGSPEYLAGQPLVRFPMLVPAGVDPERVILHLQAQGVYAGRWYRPVLFPGTDTPESYAYTPGDPALATTHDVVGRLVNLPTNVSPERARQIAGLALEAVAAQRAAA